MKGLGLFALIVGIVVAIVAFTMDVSVPTGYGGRVNNIGLMSERQNYILIGCFIILCGLLMIIFCKKKDITPTSKSDNYRGCFDTKCPFCAELIKPEAIKCKHCGSDLEEAHSSCENRFDLSSIVLFDGKRNILNNDLVKDYAKYLFSITDDKSHFMSENKERIEQAASVIPDELKGLFKAKIDYWASEFSTTER
ncbi:zinc ribbon domain-containing protein [Providencia manganoxydans]|uniref:zinc ribbon domain-containing protein n=1 Tax=Providencia manganoxydans TaxID=2923283 RepID=UPI0034E44D6F